MLTSEKEKIIAHLRSVCSYSMQNVLDEAIRYINDLDNERKVLLHQYEDCTKRLQELSMENYKLKERLGEIWQ